MIDFCNLWWVSFYECEQTLQKEEMYGHGLYKRKKDRNLPFKEEYAKMHEESYNFWLDLFTYKLMNEDRHWPMWTIKPRWEEEKARWDWERYWLWLENRNLDRR